MTPKRIILVRHGRSAANDDSASAVVFGDLTLQRVNISIAGLDAFEWWDALSTGKSRREEWWWHK